SVLFKSGAYMTAPESQFDSDRFTISVPHDDYEATVIVKSMSTTTTSGSSGSGAYVVNPIGSDAVILDSEAARLLRNTPLIVVGGPYVNSVAATLLGNPSDEEIETLFSEGLAKIRLFSDRNALLVAGYSAQDTRSAGYVLADYRDYASQ